MLMNLLFVNEFEDTHGVYVSVELVESEIIKYWAGDHGNSRLLVVFVTDIRTD